MHLLYLSQHLFFTKPLNFGQLIIWIEIPIWVKIYMVCADIPPQNYSCGMLLIMTHGQFNGAVPAYSCEYRQFWRENELHVSILFDRAKLW
jgi:hypothetical protein